jgi:circadian clock protein KaiB
MDTLHLELYVIGQSTRSLTAIANLERICREHLEGQFELTIVDVLDHPEAAEAANIIATPTLIRRAPAPVRRLVGDLSLTELVLLGLGIADKTAATPDGGITSHG